MAPTEAQVLDRLRGVEDPDLRRDIVSLGFVKNLQIQGGHVAFDIDLTTPACPVREDLESQARQLVQGIPGVEDVKIRITSTTRSPGVANLTENLKQVRAVVVVASGKGGVGKSTVTANLAAALAAQGAKVGVLDADVYGPSIPGMFGIPSRGDAALQSAGPLRPEVAHGVRVLSLGLFASKDTPIVWRGPMATKLVQTFLAQAEWGELDYLLVDLPPGTGDIQLTLAQSVPLTGVVIVTTPQETAANVAERGARMYPKLNVPILGVVENMSHYECRDCGHVAHVFRTGGGQRVSDLLGAPLLGQVPLEEAVATSSDLGSPIVVREPEAGPARAYREAVKRLVRRVSTAQFALRAGERATPKEYRSRADGRFQVTWSDDHVGEYDPRSLRGECPCAHCVDEWTGQRRVTAKDVRADVEVQGADTIGRYAVRFHWSDGHSTGLYTFARLRALCACADCQRLRNAPTLRAVA